MSRKTFKPTISQQKAMTAANRSVIVSAAAGSGKTRVLVERYIGLLAEGYAPEKILVITFTRKAAAQLKERTMRELLRRNEPGMKLLTPRVSAAPISTIHSFCSQLIREFASKLDIDPSFVTLEEDVAEEMKERSFRRIVLRYAREEESRESYANLLRLFGTGRDDSGLKAMVFELFEFLRRLPEPEMLTNKWLGMYKETEKAKTFEETAWGKLYMESLGIRVNEFKILFEARKSAYGKLPIPFNWRDQMEFEIAMVNGILNAFPDIVKMAVIADGDWVDKRMPSKKEGDDERAIKWKEDWKQFRDSIAKNFAEEWLSPPDEMLGDLRRLWNGGSLQFLLKIVKEFGLAYATSKKNANSLDFADLERQAYRLISEVASGDELVANAVEQRFTHILMDEYQDTNPLQDAIVDRLAASENARAFRVGDVKQSIYRFRHAEPDLFQDRYNDSEDSESEECGNRRVDLADNFRSAQPIVNFVNEIMRRVMTGDFGGAEYTQGHELRHMFGSVEEEPDYSGEFPAVSVKLISNTAIGENGEEPEAETDADADSEDASDGEVADDESPEELDRTRREAAIIAREIIAMMNANPKIQVYEETGGKLQKVDLRLGHITILLSAVVNSTNAYAEVFSELGIPLWGTGRDILTDEPVVRDVISLLEVIDNPIQDIPLAACLLGTACNAPPDSVYLVRNAIGKSSSLYDAVSALATGELDDVLAAEFASIEDSPSRNLIERGIIAIRDFNVKLAEMRRFAASHPVSETVRFALMKSGVAVQAGAGEDFAEALRRVEWIFARSADFDARSLPQFVQYLKTQFQIELPVGGVGDSVQLMSIHQAKGLEFPVVFLAGAGKQFNLQDVRSANILFDRTLGFGCKIIHEQKPVRYPAASFKTVYENMLRQQLEEELRKLYVGMTRARERLYLVGTVRQNDFVKLAARRVRDAGGFVSEREKAIKFTDWILPCLMESADFLEKIGEAGIDLPDSDLVARWEGGFAAEIAPDMAIDCWYDGARREREISAGGKTKAVNAEPVTIDEIAKMLPDILLAEYALSPLARIPSKIGASTLSALDDPEGFSTAPQIYRHVYSLPSLQAAGGKASHEQTGEMEPPAASMREAALARGIATHSFLQHLPFGNGAKIDIHAEIARAAETGKISDASAKLINADAIEKMLCTELGSRLQGTGKAITEWSFVARLEAKDVFSNGRVLRALTGGSFDASEIGSDIKIDGDFVILQGAVDLIFEDAKGRIIVDWKTDSLAADEAEGHAHRYELQMFAYKYAVERAFGNVESVNLAFINPAVVVTLAGD